MSDIAIRVRDLGKKYRIGARLRKSASAGEAIRRGAAAPFRWLIDNLRGPSEEEIVWAVRGISFEVRRGEVLGLIGRNGAGKSTLLKILSRITEPTEGVADINGTVGSLLEVGTGFHPELTGRENVFLNGAILGMRHGEVQRLFDEIVDFAGVERFIDTPVKRYSSGMRVRLGFAVAAHLEPDILIVDEVLSVGDVAFRRKCIGKMGEVAGQGRTVLFVSHNLTAVQNLCTRGALLRSGLLVAEGPVDEVVREYTAQLSAPVGLSEENPDRSGDGRMRMTGIRLLDEAGRAVNHVVSGPPTAIVVDYENPGGVTRCEVVMTIYTRQGQAVTNLSTRFSDRGLDLPPARGRIRCDIPRLPLPEGRYRVAVAIQTHTETCDLVPNALVFEVVSSTFFPGGRTPDPAFCACMVDHEWTHEAVTDDGSA